MAVKRFPDDYSEKTSVVDNDQLALADSASSDEFKNVKISTIKSAVRNINEISEKTSIVDADQLMINDSADSNNPKKVLQSTIITDVLSDIVNQSAKATPTGSDLAIINDVADSNNPKKVTIQSINTATIQSGAGAPGSTPDYVGQIYIDTTNDVRYMSVDTSGSTDWIVIQDVVIDTSDPSGAPGKIGDLFINTATPAIWISTGTSGVGDWSQVFPLAGYEYEFEGDTAGSSAVLLATANNSTVDIKIKKPIMARIFKDFTGSTSHTTTLSVLMGGSYRTIYSNATLSDQNQPETLNPGKYRLADSHSGGSGSGVSYLYATGVANGELTTASITET